jgi:tetratricopeptide (TPR) repeat protein
MWMLEKYRKVYAERIIDRAESYVVKGWLKSAVRCYEGFLKQHWSSPEIHERLGKLYYELGNNVKAGRYFYFKRELTESEAECVSLFEKSFGNDPVLILKRLLNKCCQPISELDSDTKQKLNDLLKEALRKNGFLPVFAQGMKRHFEKSGLE